VFLIQSADCGLKLAGIVAPPQTLYLRNRAVRRKGADHGWAVCNAFVLAIAAGAVRSLTVAALLRLQPLQYLWP